EFAPGGRDARVFMAGEVQVTTGSYRSRSWSTSAYRIPLDGTSPAQLLFRVDHGYRLHSSRFGAVFAMPKNLGQKCDHGGCSVGSIIAYEIVGDRATWKTLLDGKALDLGRARLIPGSNDARIAIMLDASRPKRIELLRWRYGEAGAQFRTLQNVSGDDASRLLITKTDELVEFRRGDGQLEIFRHGAGAPEPIATLGALQVAHAEIHGVGERPDGSFWVHWGDELGFLVPGKPPRGHNLAALVPRLSEWGGDIYIPAPEQLWLGIDGRGRDYLRLNLADAEKRAKPWPADNRSGVTGSGGEGAVTFKKDPSTPNRLYATTSLRAVPGGLISIGGERLRRLTAGAAKWEVVHEVSGDSLYRVAADDAGRLLASWEKETVIHYISPGEGRHVTLPKPTLFFTTRDGHSYNALHVERLEFAPNGRDALVFTTGQVGASSKFITLAH